jgi:hypothetical protein
MTALELILIIIIWIAYGVLSAHQYNKKNRYFGDLAIGVYIRMIIFSPFVLLFRIIRGAFSACTLKE